MGKWAWLLPGLLLTVLLLLGCSAGKAQTTDTAGAEPVDGSSTEAIPESTANAEEPELTVTVTVADGGLLAREDRELLADFMTLWYRSVGSFEIEDFTPVFLDEEEALRHAASCRTQAAIRTAALEDLHLTHCRVTLTVTDVYGDTVSASETTVMQFAGLPGIKSELFDMPHTFVLTGEGDNSRIAYHAADDNPYTDFSYDTERGVDAHYDDLMENIERRREQGWEDTAERSCGHPYDRQAALKYMLTYADHRNSEWYAYDDVGGNCMNFGSQVLLAGGIPMDYSGYDCWFSNGTGGATNSFVNVGWFLDYAQCNAGFGLVADTEANYYTGQIGDLLLVGIYSPRHTTEICGLVTDDSGRTVDYLLCSNTTNYRNFPAGAYYYTRHWLVRICGWND